MKQFLITILVLLFTFQTTNCQVIELVPNSSPQVSYDYYMLKQKQNKTAAWIFLGGGVAVTVVGAAIGSNAAEKNPLGTLSLRDEGAKAGILLIVIGGASTLASIPFFISAGSNKRKAMLALKGVQNSAGNIKFDNSNYLSVSVTIPF